MSNTVSTIKSDISALEAAMLPNQELAARLAQMEAAVSALAQQERKLEALRVRLGEAERADAGRKAAIARYTIESISSGEGYGLATPRTVRFTERFHNSMMGVDDTRPGKMPLHGCTAGVWAAIMADPSKIPAEILALDADPSVAVDIHAKFCRQGYASR
ncbi:hypothetical protein AB4Z27_04350 [Cupriavidus sp. KB_39]|uniref:hypothetical protein n=1 Tax=Cupriavidus sp. KB_39 TaxID=3233036 RepID=UPI003F8F0C0A